MATTVHIAGDVDEEVVGEKRGELEVNWIKGVIAFLLASGLAALAWFLGYQGVTPDGVGMLVIAGFGIIIALLVGAYFLARANRNVLAVVCACSVGVVSTILWNVLKPSIGVGGTAALLGAFALVAFLSALAGACLHKRRA